MELDTSINIWQLTALEFKNKVWIEGTVLQGKNSRKQSSATWAGHFIEVFSSYFKDPAAEVQLTLNTGKEEIQIQSNEKGRFNCLVNRFDHTSLRIFHQGVPLPFPEGYPFYFDRKPANVEVISDLDDTVLHSHTASALKRMYSILFVIPQKRKPVTYTRELMDWFNRQQVRITYLSKSESNLFELIAAFLRSNDLPRGALLLSPFLRYHQLPKPNKGKDYKYDHLRTFLREQPDNKIILLGDDTQRDMEIYTSIIHEFPERILKVYIRQTRLTQNERQKELWNRLRETGVPAVYFTDGEEAKREIAHLSSILK